MADRNENYERFKRGTRLPGRPPASPADSGARSTTDAKPPIRHDGPRQWIAAQVPTEATAIASRFRFEAAEKAEDGVAVSMRLRGLEAITHWYWGRIVHDMAGLTVHKDRLPIDYCHDPGQILGYLDTFSTENGLDVSGKIFPEIDDRAREVYEKQLAGVPYEASMDWADPETELEWIPDGGSTDVNGLQFEGPGYVVRKWSLRGAAVCPYGADKYASTSFGGRKTAEVALFAVGAAPQLVDIDPTGDLNFERFRRGIKLPGRN